MLVKRGMSVENRNYVVDVPDACPMCHRHSEVQFAVTGMVEEGQGVQAVFRCSYLRCRGFFICFYGRLPASEPLAVRPIKPPESMFPETISKLSPMFVLIFGEANEAKHLGLKQIAGPVSERHLNF